MNNNIDTSDNTYSLVHLFIFGNMTEFTYDRSNVMYHGTIRYVHNNDVCIVSYYMANNILFTIKLQYVVGISMQLVSMLIVGLLEISNLI